MEDKQFTKLGNLVNSTFVVEGVKGYSYKRWNVQENRMEKSDRWAEGFQKKWLIETDKGLLDLGTGQMGNLLEAVHKDGVSNIIGKQFQVKSNGKEGKEIRYFLNHIPEWKQSANAQSPEAKDSFSDGAPLPDDDDDILSEIPF